MRMCVNFVYISTLIFVIIIHLYSCSFWDISMNFDFELDFNFDYVRLNLCTIIIVDVHAECIM